MVARFVAPGFRDVTQDVDQLFLGRFKFFLGLLQFFRQARRFNRLGGINSRQDKAFQVLPGKYRTFALLVDGLVHTHHLAVSVTERNRHDRRGVVVGRIVAPAIETVVLVGIFDQQVFARLDGIADKAGPDRDAQLVHAMRYFGPKFICLGIDKPQGTAVSLH